MVDEKIGKLFGEYIDSVNDVTGGEKTSEVDAFILLVSK